MRLRIDKQPAVIDVDGAERIVDEHLVIGVGLERAAVEIKRCGTRAASDAGGVGVELDRAAVEIKGAGAGMADAKTCVRIRNDRGAPARIGGGS